MGIFGDLKKGIQRNLNRVTDNKIAKTVTGGVSGIADACSSMTLKSKKHDLVRLPHRASRYISYQKSITEHLHFLLIKDAKKRKECQNRVKSLCAELDSIEKEFLKVDERFNFSRGNDDEKLREEVAEFESLLRPVIGRHREVSEKLEAVINEVNHFIDPSLIRHDEKFPFSGAYDESEIRSLKFKVRSQRQVWDIAQMQYENPDLLEKMKVFEDFDKRE